MQRYMALLGFYKLKHSEVPAHIRGNQEALTAYCKQLNAEMNFRQLIGMELTPDQLEENPEMRAFFKDALVKVGKDKEQGNVFFSK